jgi:hypothetical protein
MQQPREDNCDTVDGSENVIQHYFHSSRSLCREVLEAIVCPGVKKD